MWALTGACEPRGSVLMGVNHLSTMDRRVLATGFVIALVACSKGSPFPPPPPSNPPQLPNVQPVGGADTLTVTFDPVDGAKDYRIYLVADSTGAGTANKPYRCGGNREAPPLPVDDEPLPPSGAMKALIN